MHKYPLGCVRKVVPIGKLVNNKEMREKASESPK